MKRSSDISESMVTLTDRQTAMMVADLEKVLRSTKDLKAYNTTRKLLLMLKRKQRYELLHKGKGLRKGADD